MLAPTENIMDRNLLAKYRAPQRPPVFLAARPATRTKRPLWPLLVYAILVGFAVVGCAVIIL